MLCKSFFRPKRRLADRIEAAISIEGRIPPFVRDGIAACCTSTPQACPCLEETGSETGAWCEGSLGKYGYLEARAIPWVGFPSAIDLPVEQLVGAPIAPNPAIAPDPARVRASGSSQLNDWNYQSKIHIDDASEQLSRKTDHDDSIGERLSRPGQPPASCRYHAPRSHANRVLGAARRQPDLRAAGSGHRPGPTTQGIGEAGSGSSHAYAAPGLPSNSLPSTETGSSRSPTSPPCHLLPNCG